MDAFFVVVTGAAAAGGLALFGRGAAGGLALFGRGAAGGGPVNAVVLFHGRIASGGLAEIERFFSFGSAYNYWRDVTASLGASCPGEDEFRRMVMEVFGDETVRAEVSSYGPCDLRQKVIASVASVVFRREGAAPGDGPGAASTVMEEGRWKVRTYPGVFPGPLLAKLKLGARQGGEEGCHLK